MKSVKNTELFAVLAGLRELLQADVGVATQVLKAFVGDVILETRQVAGQAKPHEVARSRSTPCRSWRRWSETGRSRWP